MGYMAASVGMGMAAVARCQLGEKRVFCYHLVNVLPIGIRSGRMWFCFPSIYDLNIIIDKFGIPNNSYDRRRYVQFSPMGIQYNTYQPPSPIIVRIASDIFVIGCHPYAIVRECVHAQACAR